MARRPDSRPDSRHRTFGGLASQSLPRLLLCLVGLQVCLVTEADAADGNEVTVISLDYCADQYVLALADREQILGLSRGADKSYSYYSHRAQGLPRLYGTIDEITFHGPDVVVQTWGIDTRMQAAAGSQGIAVALAEYGSDPEIVMRNVLQIGKALGQMDRAETLVNEYRNRLALLGDLPPLEVRAAYITPSGVTAGEGTFVDKILLTAGLQSWAASQKLKGWQSLPLGGLILDPPDAFVTSFFDTSQSSQSNWSIARHRRLYRMMSERPVVDLPGRLLACNGLFLAEAAHRIREAIEEQFHYHTQETHIADGGVRD